jgi:hypothetical protein
MSQASQVQQSMDPTAYIEQGEQLILSSVRSSAPAWLSRPAMASLAAAAPRKALPAPKERLPVAASVDPNQVRNTLSLMTPAAPVAPPTKSVVAPTSLTVATRFLGGIDDGRSIPPDISGAVGPHHVFNPLNNNVSIFDRSGHHLGSTTLDGFWHGLGLTGSTFDPRATYDSREGRFVFVALANAEQANSSLYIAVSQSADPTQSWFGDAIQVDDTAQGESWLDFPNVGFTADKVTITVNMYSRSGNAFVGATVYVLDKRSLYDPPHQAATMRFVLRNQGGTHVPAITHDPGQADQFLVSRWSGNLQGDGYLSVYRVSGSVANQQAVLNRVGFIIAKGASWEAFPPGDFGPQSAIPQLVDIGDDRILAVSLRGGVLYCCHTVLLPSGGPGRSAVQWWEIDSASWQLNARQRVDDPTNGMFYAYPSLAVNQRGDLLLGLAQFSASTHPSAAYVYRAAGAAPLAPVILQSGLDTYYKTFGAARNRWGDYTITQVDPEGDRDFWTCQEFAQTPKDTWATLWALIQV